MYLIYAMKKLLFAFTTIIFFACHQNPAPEQPEQVPLTDVRSEPVAEPPADDYDFDHIDLFKEPWHQLHHDESGDHILSSCGGRNGKLEFKHKDGGTELMFGMVQEDRLLKVVETRVVDAHNRQLKCVEPANGDTAVLVIDLEAKEGKLYYTSPFNQVTSAYVPASQVKDYPVKKERCDD